jgi:hypothetical protein
MTTLRHPQLQQPRIVPGPLAPSAQRHTTPRSAARNLGPCVYAAALQDGRIVVDHTDDLGHDVRRLRCGWANILLVIPARYPGIADEFSARFGAHRLRPRTFAPAPEILDWIREQRDTTI